jgi:hypothetical protein
MGLHLEQELPPSNEPEELVNALWENEFQKRVWMALVTWDKYVNKVVLIFHQ